MGDFLIGLLISIAIGIIIIVVIFLTTKEKKNAGIKIEAKEPVEKGHEEHNANEDHGHDKPSKKSFGSILWNIILVAITIVIIVWTFNFVSNLIKKWSEPKNYEYIEVNFSNRYSYTVYLPSGSMFALLYATEPYCCMNEDGLVVCGEKGEDVSTQMGDTNANTKLRFKSKNGRIGSLKIRVRNK